MNARKSKCDCPGLAAQYEAYPKCAPKEEAKCLIVGKPSHVRCHFPKAASATAGENSANAVREIGLDRWPRYLAEADRRVVAAVSNGAVAGVIKMGSGDAVVSGAVVGGLMLGAILGSSSSVRAPAPVLPRSMPAPLSPSVVEAVAVPPPKDSETPTDILKPDGRLVGQAGSSADIRELPGGKAGADDLFDRLTKGGTDITSPTYPGRRVRLPNGDTIGYRPKSTSGPPTIDVDVAGLGIDKLKFPGR